jgi:hypothetical protein
LSLTRPMRPARRFFALPCLTIFWFEWSTTCENSAILRKEETIR